MASRFNILVIEDAHEKSDAIRLGLLDRVSEPELTIELVSNLVEALKLLEVNYYDLVILDILIPATDRGSPRTENSRAIIEQLASGSLVMPACVVGLTAYEQEYQAELRYYAENLFSIEQFRPDSDDWLKSIVSKIKFIAKWKAAYGRAHSASYDYDVVLVTARFQNEYKPIVDSIQWASGPNDDIQLFRDRRLKTGAIRFGERVLRAAVYCIEGMGLAPAAAVAEQLIGQLRPKLLVMLGMCCGFRQEKCQNRSALGDVIVTRQAACWDEGKYGELAEEGFFFNRALPVSVDGHLDRLISSLLESEGEIFRSAVSEVWNERGSKNLRKKFKADVGDYPDVKYGLLLSGSSVVAHDVKGDEIINRFPNALGLEMEIFGFFKAIELAVGAKPAMMAVKGVADFGDGSKHKLFQPLASRLSYCVASEIISNYFNRIDGQSKK